MHPQYVPQQPFGISPQGLPVSRSSPSSGPPPPSQSFQNIPLGPQKPILPPQHPGGPPSFPPRSSPLNQPSGLPSRATSGQFPPNLGSSNSNVRTQVPPNQLPPGQDPRPPGGPPNPVGLPPGQDPRPPGGPPKPVGLPPGQDPKPPTGLPSQVPPMLTSKPGGPQDLKNGPPQYMNGPPQFQNRPPPFQDGPGFAPLPQNHPPSSKDGAPHIAPPHGPSQFGPPSHAQPRPGQPPPLLGTNSINAPLPAANIQPPISGQPLMNHHPPVPGLQTLPSQNPQLQQPPMAGHLPPPIQNSALDHQPTFNPVQQPGQFAHGPPGHLGGQIPPNRQFNQPPLGQQQLPGQQGFNPPLLGQPPLGPNQLANQMQGMNVGPRQYPGNQFKNSVNGDNGPHMPPPIAQQQYVNGQQMRGAPGAGYPPMPGQQVPPTGPGAYPQQAYQQPQQAKRLDPDQMPSPIQVTQDDQQNRSGLFCTNQKGLVPPLVTTNFTVQDQGNASPRLIRSSMYNVPISQDIMKQTAVPFSLVISPMARPVDQEYPPPIVNFGDLGPVRCIRCKAYICPYMQFIDSGRRFQCLFCKATTDVPQEYFQHLDHTGQRLDRYERPELVLGAYEFVATQEYCRNNTLPKPPAIIFIIDVSYNNVKSGLVHLLCSQIKDIIQNLPVDQGQEKSNMRVGFITYNSSVHFYNIKGSLAAPQMLIVGDVVEMFMPLLDGFLCTPEESGPVIDALMQQIPAMFGETRETETILLPAILAGLEALKASECTGKLLVFHSTLPTAEAPGKLKNRDDRKLLSTEKERTVLIPQTQAYNQLGQDCVAAGCCVDLFVFNNAYIDIATIGQVSRLTGGEVHKYTYFQADIDGDRLIKDVITNISRLVAFDAIMRVRSSTGVRPTDFYGHFYMSNTTDMEIAAIDCDKAVAVEIKHDDKLSEEEGVYIQAALLYTSCSGQRRLRIINLSLKTCSQMADLYRNCDCDTIINYISKQATYKLFEHNPKAVKDSIVTRAAQILATYRKNCASPSSAGQLILPECMKLLPLYVNCLLKSDALSGGPDITLDDRSFVMQEVMIMDIPTSVNYFYPRLIPLIDLDPTQEPVEIPSPIRCTVDKMNEQGVYILENGIHMFLWIGLGVNPDFIQKVFGVQAAIQVDIEKVALPELDNALSEAVRTVIDEIRIQRHRWMRLTIVRQREKLEPVFKHFLAEDRGTDGSPSYVDFLIHMHKEIRSLLS